MSQLKPYPAYKDSAFEWLGALPEHWGIGALKHLAWIRNGRDYKDVSSSDGEYPVIGSGGQFAKATQYLYDGESVLLGRKGTIDKPLYIHGRFWTVDTMFYTEISPRAFAKFIYYTSLRIPFQYYSTSTALPSMTQGDLLNHTCAIPTFAEQALIARFLDYKTAHIDALIEEQQRLIVLLKEKRRSIALAALADQSLPLVRIEHIVDVVSRPVRQKEGETYIPIGLFNRDRGLFRKEPREMQEMGDSDFFWVHSGDLAISGQFAWEGAVALAGDDEEGVVVSHRYPILRGREGIALTEFVYAILTTKHGDFLLNECSRGAAGRNRPLNLTALLKELIRVPAMATQDSVRVLVQHASKVQAKCNEQIMLLQERRAALISAVVTGKIDVRGWEPPASAKVQELEEEAM